MRIDWSEYAREDLDDLIRYISQDSSVNAQEFAKRIVLATRRLHDFPESGRTVPEANDKTIREIIVQGYRVMYQLQSDHVSVLAIIHGSRNVDMMPMKPWQM